MTRAPYTRTSQSSGADEEARLLRMEEMGLRLANLARTARKAKQELDEASSWGASGGSVTPGRSVQKDSDPTGTVAVSGPHAVMREAVRALARMISSIDTRSLERSLSRVEKKAEDAIRLAWDSDLRQMLARADEAERDYRARRKPA